MRVAILRKLLGPYPWALPTLVGLGLLASLAEGLSIGVLFPVLSSVVQPAEGASPSPLEGWMQTYAEWFAPDLRLPLLGATIFALILLKAIVTYAFTYVGEWLNGSVAHTLRMGITRQILDVEYTFILRQPTGRLIDTLEHQTWRAGEVLSRLCEVLVTGATVLVFLGLLLLTSWQLTLAVGAGVVLASSVAFLLFRRARRLGDEAVAASQGLVARQVDLLDSMRMVRIFGQEDREYDTLYALSERERHTYMTMDLVAGMVTPVLEVLFVPLLLIAFGAAWQLGVSPSVLLICLVLFYRLQPKIQHCYKACVQLASLLGAVEDATAFLTSDQLPILSSGDQPFERLETAVEFQDVAFRYPSRAASPSDAPVEDETPPTVQGLSFRIERGKMLGIVGGSGGGKSTIVHLIARLCDPHQGQILVDGVPLPSLVTRSWRARVAATGQDAELISGTIAENIAYGRPDASPESIERAAKRAEAHAFISGFPEQYQTQVGSRGRSLSEGQRQRIGLARALLTEPCVLVLDEAMSALDNDTATAIEATIRKLTPELALVVIAHRLRAVRHADQILVMSKGRIVEQGDYETLCAGAGMFARLEALEREGIPASNA